MESFKERSVVKLKNFYTVQFLSCPIPTYRNIFQNSQPTKTPPVFPLNLQRAGTLTVVFIINAFPTHHKAHISAGRRFAARNKRVRLAAAITIRYDTWYDTSPVGAIDSGTFRPIRGCTPIWRDVAK